ncbi:hypothetical protein C8Q76DRAFT_697914 [Earliella scabrosa]|nr:hypothetical protein C8Q76DRAFT_697914 [Earliella scabrosa]
MAGHRIVESDAEDDAPPRKSVKPSPKPGRVTSQRASKAKAAEAWQDLVPGSKAPVKKPVKPAQVANAAISDATVSKKKSTKKKTYCPPTINLDTSEDEDESQPVTQTQKSSKGLPVVVATPPKASTPSKHGSSKSLKSTFSLVQSKATPVEKVSKARQPRAGETTKSKAVKQVETESNEEDADDENETSEEDEAEEEVDKDGDAESSSEDEESGTDKMEPRALEAMLNTEAVIIVDDDNGDVQSGDDNEETQEHDAPDHSLNDKDPSDGRSQTSSKRRPLELTSTSEDGELVKPDPPKPKKVKKVKRAKKAEQQSAQVVQAGKKQGHTSNAQTLKDTPGKVKAKKNERPKEPEKAKGNASVESVFRPLRMPLRAAAPKRKRSNPDETIKFADDSHASTEERTPSKRSKTRDSARNDDEDDLSEVSSDEDNDGNDSGIDLVLTPGSSKLSLRAQHGRVKRVASRAIDELLTDVCLINAFPDGPEKSSDFAKCALIKSAKAYGYTNIVNRLKKDKHYCLKLTTIPVQRLPNFRGKFKKATDSAPPNLYGLVSGDVDFVSWLQESDRFVFPNDYKVASLHCHYMPSGEVCQCATAPIESEASETLQTANGATAAPSAQLSAVSVVAQQNTTRNNPSSSVLIGVIHHPPRVFAVAEINVLAPLAPLALSRVTDELVRSWKVITAYTTTTPRLLESSATLRTRANHETFNILRFILAPSILSRTVSETFMMNLRSGKTTALTQRPRSALRKTRSSSSKVRALPSKAQAPPKARQRARKHWKSTRTGRRKTFRERARALAEQQPRLDRSCPHLAKERIVCMTGTRDDAHFYIRCEIDECHWWMSRQFTSQRVRRDKLAELNKQHPPCALDKITKAEQERQAVAAMLRAKSLDHDPAAVDAYLYGGWDIDSDSGDETSDDEEEGMSTCFLLYCTGSVDMDSDARSSPTASQRARSPTVSDYIALGIPMWNVSVQNGQGTRIGRFNICQFRDEVTRFGIPLDEMIAFFTRSHGDWRFIQVNDILPHVIKLQCDDDFVWARFRVTDLPGLFLHAPGLAPPDWNGLAQGHIQRVPSPWIL